MSVGAGEAIRTSGTAWNLDIIMPYTLKKYFVLRYYIYEEAPLNFFYYMITKFYGGSQKTSFYKIHKNKSRGHDEKLTKSDITLNLISSAKWAVL